MNRVSPQGFPQRRLLITVCALGLVGASGVLAQEPQQAPAQPQQQSGGWRRFGDAPRPEDQQPQPPITAEPAESDQDQQGPVPVYRQDYPVPVQGGYPQQQPPPQGYPPQQPQQPPYYPNGGGQPNYGPVNAPPPVQVGPTLTIPSGTWITVRLNQPLSSDHNQPGDAFTGSLVQPLVVNGIVVARRGEMVAGRVADVQKAGRTQGVSRLGIELTEVALVDGQQLPLHTQLVGRQGDTSVGQDVAAVGATAGIGAAIGAAAGGGFGAGMGAIAGAGAATIGVLSTRGRGTYVGPESVLTFRLADSMTISTERAPYAFQPVGQQDYSQPQQQQLQRRAYGPGPGGPGYYGGVAPYPYYARPYPYFYGPGYYGPSFYFYSGPPRFYGRYYGRRW